MSFSAGLISPPAPSSTRNSSVKLDVTPDGKQIVFTQGRGVFLRTLYGAKAYFGHQKEATVARVSPSGFYCASGDVSGLVRVWDLAGEDQILKSEVKVINGRINDLAWDGESKRIIAVGDGKERFGHAFMFDSGSSVGEISGHSKVVNTVASRRDRPFRAVTGSDDGSLVFLHGAPYKFARTIKTHTSFVNAVAYSPTGEAFVSVGADRKVFSYDGKTGDPHGSDLSNGHTGSVFAACWSPDGKQFATSSADCTVKVWDAATQTPVQTFTLSETPTPEHHQVGNVWALPHEIVSMSFSGDLNCFDLRSSKVAAVLTGHQRGITALTRSPTSQTLFSGSYDGRINQFSDVQDHNACKSVTGAGHTNGVVSLAPTGSHVVSVGMDDSLRTIDTSKGAFSPTFASTSKLPTALAADSNGTSFVATVGDVQLHQAGSKPFSLPVDYTPRSIAHSAKRNEVAVGGEDARLRIYTVAAGPTLSLAHTGDPGRGGSITSLAYNPSGDLLAAGDAQGKIVVYDAATRAPKLTQWCFHTARINSIAWTEDSKHAASGALDGHCYIWSVAKPMRNIAIKGAHPGGVNGVVWEGASRLVSAGSDATVRRWDVKFHV